MPNFIARRALAKLKEHYAVFDKVLLPVIKKRREFAQSNYDSDDFYLKHLINSKDQNGENELPAEHVVYYVSVVIWARFD